MIMHGMMEHFLYFTDQGSNPDTHVGGDYMFTPKAIHNLQLGDFNLSTEVKAFTNVTQLLTF